MADAERHSFSTEKFLVKQSLSIGFGIAAIVLLLGPFSAYSPSGFLDPWIPTGYFTNFQGMLDRFGIPYYVTRLPYILPGLFLYKVFSPEVANFLLNLLILGSCCTSLYVVANTQLSSIWSAALTVLFSTNPYVISTIVWDYPDGASIAYFMLGVAILSRSSLPQSSNVQIACIGGMWAMSGFVNLIAGLIILPITFYLLVTSCLTLHEFTRRIVSLAAGVLCAVVMFGLLSKMFLGQWDFLGPQVGQFFYAMNTDGYLENMWGTGYDWIGDAFRLCSLFGALLVGFPLIIRCFSRNSLLRSFYLVGACSATLFLIVEFVMHGVVLRVFYHSSYLIAPAFVLLVYIVRFVLQGESSKIQAGSENPVEAVLLIVTATILAIVHGKITSLPSVLIWIILGVAIIITIVATTPEAHFPYKIGIMAISFAVIMNLGSLYDSTLQWIYADSRGSFEAAMKTQRLLTSGIIHDRPIRFWHDSDERFSPLFHSINSLYLWGYRDLTKELPLLTPSERDRLLPPGIALIHLTSHKERIGERKELLEKSGIRGQSAQIWKIHTRSGIEFNVGVQETEHR